MFATLKRRLRSSSQPRKQQISLRRYLPIALYSFRVYAINILNQLVEEQFMSHDYSVPASPIQRRPAILRIVGGVLGCIPLATMVFWPSFLYLEARSTGTWPVGSSLFRSSVLSVIPFGLAICCLLLGIGKDVRQILKPSLSIQKPSAYTFAIGLGIIGIGIWFIAIFNTFGWS